MNIIEQLDIAAEMRAHVARRYRKQIVAAKEWGVTCAFVSLVLNGHKPPPEWMLAEAGIKRVRTVTYTKNNQGGSMSIKTWRERIGVSPDFPLHCATNVERAMSDEIAELRKAWEVERKDAARYRVLREHVAPRDVSISMRVPPQDIPADQSIEARIDMLCDQLIGTAA